MSNAPDEIAREWFKEVWDEGREETIDRLMAPYAVAYGLPGGPIQGPTAFKPFFRTFREALGDLSVEVVRTVVQGDVVAAHCHVTGKHTGVALGGNPTNQPVDFWGIAILRVEDGRVVEAWNCFDMLRCISRSAGWHPTRAVIRKRRPAHGPSA